MARTNTETFKSTAEGCCIASSNPYVTYLIAYN